MGGGSDNDIEGLNSHIYGMNEEDAAEDWEHELDETVQHPLAEIKDWQVLQAQIKQDINVICNQSAPDLIKLCDTQVEGCITY